MRCLPLPSRPPTTAGGARRGPAYRRARRPRYRQQGQRVDIAKESQNPVGNLTILPFENYTSFNVGPNPGTLNILEFEPVVPIHLNEDWNLITRAIIPAVWNSGSVAGPSVPQAIAPTNFSAFLSPRNAVNGVTWGVGPIIQIPALTSTTVGSSVWSAGPSAVVVKTTEHIVAGVLVNNIWSFGGRQGPYGNRYATFLLEPFFNYNFGHGWFMNSAPLITASWDTPGTKWTVPIGLEAGRMIKLGGKLPVNCRPACTTTS